MKSTFLRKSDSAKPRKTWVMQEIKNCRLELAELSKSMLPELENREKQCLPKLMYLHHSCLDFGSHFSALC